jgi:hypothetical protein
VQPATRRVTSCSPMRRRGLRPVLVRFVASEIEYDICYLIFNTEHPIIYLTHHRRDNSRLRIYSISA